MAAEVNVTAKHFYFDEFKNKKKFQVVKFNSCENFHLMGMYLLLRVEIDSTGVIQLYSVKISGLI